MKHICKNSFNDFDNTQCSHDYVRVVAIGEKSAGNESVGDMWLETKTFSIDTPVSNILKWAWSKNINGKLIITIDESSEKQKDE